MDTSRRTTIVRNVGVVVLCAGALWQLSLLVWLFASRARYPWDVEWLESSALYQAYRVMRHLPTYGPFKDGYIPLAHPPGYPIALGLLGRVIGLDYGMARMVSWLFFFGAAALVVRAIVRHHQGRDGRGRREGIALAGFAIACAAAGVPFFDGFYDLVREDTMAMFLSVLAATLVDTEPKMRPRRIAAISLTVAAIVYTRYPAVFFPVWIVLYAFLRHRRTGVLLAVGSAAACGLLLVAVQFASKGYYWMLTISMLQDQRILGERFLQGLGIIGRFAPFVVAVPIVAAVLARYRRLSAPAALWLGMLVASIPASLLPFAKLGGFANDFMPVIFVAGPAAAFIASDLLKAIEKRPSAALAVQSALFVAGAVFLGVRTYNVKRYIPSAEHYRRAAALNAKIASLTGGVLCPRHPFMPIHDGHTTLQWSDMPYMDLSWIGFGDINLGGYIDRAKAKWVVVSGTEVPATVRELVTRYQLEGPVGDAPVTLIGEFSQMRYLLRRQDSDSGGRVLFDFEHSLDGWTQTGDAFRIVPAKPAWENQIYGLVGQQLVSSYHPTKRDGATGTLTSPKFIIDHPHMALRVGGTKTGTRVELRVGGKTERKTSGIFEDNEVLIKVTWDVKALMGKEAELVLIDQDPGSWGHLLVDHVVLY